MSRKPKKGYFVRGQFVAEGSELDVEMKAELKGTTESTRTDLKRESTELQALGEDLLGLRNETRIALALPEKLEDAIEAAKKITNFEGRRRQGQFIGKLMRKLIDNDEAVQEWIQRFPATDIQQLRALVRQARKDAVPEKPGMAPRHGRAYREIFQLLRSHLQGDAAEATPSADEEDDES